jgi:hypothetical protein
MSLMLFGQFLTPIDCIPLNEQTMTIKENLLFDIENIIPVCKQLCGSFRTGSITRLPLMTRNTSSTESAPRASVDIESTIAAAV